MKKKKKKSESTRLTRQTKLTCQTWNSCHESVITKQKKDFILMN
jgi:heme A synthase